MALTPEQEQQLAAAKARLVELQGQQPQQQAAPPEESIIDKLKGFGGETLRQLDAPGAVIRDSLSKAIDALQNVGDRPILPESISDLGSSLKETFIDVPRGARQAPTAGDIRQQLGVSKEDLSIDLPVDVPGIGRSLELAPTVEGLAGAALDPLTFAGGGPVKQALQSQGKRTFAKGFKKVDDELARTNAGSFSKLAREEKIVGTSKQIAQQNRQLQSRLGNSRNKLFAEADRLNIKATILPALDKAEDTAKALAKVNPSLSEALVKKVDALRKQHKSGLLSLEDATDLKRNFREGLPDSAFITNEFGGKTLKSGAKRVEKVVADTLQKEIVTAGNRGLGGLGDEINSINKKFQTSIAANKPLAKEADKELKGLTAVDVIVGGGLSAASPEIAAVTLAVKKLNELRQTPGFRTQAGNLLEQLGAAPGLDPAVRRLLIDNLGQNNDGGAFNALGNQ